MGPTFKGDGKKGRRREGTKEPGGEWNPTKSELGK